MLFFSRNMPEYGNTIDFSYSLEIEEVTGIPVFLLTFVGIPNSQEISTSDIPMPSCKFIVSSHNLISNPQGWRMER